MMKMFTFFFISSSLLLGMVGCVSQNQKNANRVFEQQEQIKVTAVGTNANEALTLLATSLPEDKFLAFSSLSNMDDKETALTKAIFHSLEPQVLQACQKQNIRLIEREAMQLIMDEWKLEMSGLTSGDKGARELLGADILLAGKVAQEGNQAHIFLKAIDLSNGAILAATEVWQPLPANAEKQFQKPAAQVSEISNRATSDDGNLKLWTEAKEYSFGESLAVYFEVAQPAYVTLIDITPDGEKTVIFPNAAMRDNYCRPGTAYRIPPLDSPLQIEITGPAGKDRIIAFTSDKPGLDSRIVQTRGIKFTSKLVATTQSRATIGIDIKEK